MAEYKWMWEEDGETPCECMSCHMKAPLMITKNRFLDKRGEVEFRFCKLCACTFAGNATQYPDHYTDGNMMRHACALQNLLIDELTGRKPPERNNDDDAVGTIQTDADKAEQRK